LINGTNQYQFITPLPVLDLIAVGKLRPLAVTSTTRLPALKDVPTIVEQGFPQLVMQDWVGLLAKSGTPADVMARLNAAISKALASGAVRDALARMAAEPAGGSPDEFGRFVKSQIAHWGKVVREAGIRMPHQQ
jgi:tripartite-type tricarboxylate transporter receptor subunit TctC